MQENQKQSEPAAKKSQKNNVQQISVIKRSKISNYPYYPTTYTLSQNGYGYIFNLDFTAQDYTMIINPFKYDNLRNQYIQISTVYIQLDVVPRKYVNLLYVLQYQDQVNDKVINVRLIDFVIGFAGGFLIRCQYTNNRSNNMGPSKREMIIIGKYNKKADYKQGFMMRMTATFFGSDQFYKVAVEKPVRAFRCHKDKKQGQNILKYNYSYLIGTRLYLCKQFSQQIQSQAIKTFSELEWSSLPNDSLAKMNKMNSIVINSKRHRTLITTNYMLIQWADQIAQYVYTPQNQLIIADNEQNKILILDIVNNLKIKSVYRFDLDIKKINYFKNGVCGSEQNYLIVMPYDTSLYVINLNKNQVFCLLGHKSYITQAYLTQTGWIITGGCDHRIGLKYIKNVKEWSNIPIIKGSTGTQLMTRYFDMDSNNVVKAKMGQTYFLGQFNNVNSERNNSAGFGFGNFLPIQGTKMYAFITYDFIIKVYKIYV